MRPLAMLLGILMGSAVSLAAGLLMTWITLLFLPSKYASQLTAERAPLGEAIAVFTLISGAAALSFYGELRVRQWRFGAHAATLALLGLAVWIYWPR